jgi:hypothetical protein
MDAVLDALRTLLLTTAFGTEVGSRVYYGEAPRDATLPYCVFFLVSNTTDLDTFDRNSFNARVQFSIVQSELVGARDVANMMFDLRDALHRTVLTVAGHAPLEMDMDQERGPMKEGDVWVAHCDYKLEGWKT